MSLMDLNLSQELIPDSSVASNETVALEEPQEEKALEQENLKYSTLVSYITGKYHKSRDNRRIDEQRWLTAYNNYRGIYNREVQFLDTEKSRAFIKITKTKVLAAYAQILDILFAENKFPIGIDSSRIPIGIAESVHFDPKDPDFMNKKQGMDTAMPEGAGTPKKSTIARADILENIGALKDKLEPVADKLKEGPGKTPSSITYEPAKDAAREMEKKMHDQLEEGSADKELRAFVFDMCLFGTGIFKGPFAVDKEYPRWDETGKYNPVTKTIPGFSHVSVWDAYPDPDARTMEKDAELFIQRHRMSRTDLRQLKRRPHFRQESIEKAITAGPNYTREYWEHELHENELHSDIERFEVLEYWGIVDKDIAKEAGLEIPSKLRDKDQVQVNVWICNSQILRLVLNPFTPARIPFYSCPYELNPYSFFGIGIAENMEDTQLIMNGFMRLAVDNAVLSSNVILDVDETSLADGQTMDLYPGKIFRRQGGQPGTAINAIEVPNVTQAALMMFDKARQLADEATGMPSYSHGVSGVMGVGRTASGMSMLMGAAKENIKAVVRNIDDYFLIPFGKSLFAFNMQFDFDPKYVGDLRVVAKGTESLMRNEVRSQKLLQFLQIAANPMDAPYLKRDYILRELATSLDLEADKVVNDPREAAIQAEVMAEMSKIMGVPLNQGMSAGNPAGAPSPEDPTGTGGGNIAPGAAPTPGETGSTAEGGGSMNAAMGASAAAG